MMMLLQLVGVKLSGSENRGLMVSMLITLSSVTVLSSDCYELLLTAFKEMLTACI